MESSQGGLVAIMFVTILVFGIAALISNLSSILNAGLFRALDPKIVSWIFLTLLIHLNLFWETVTIQNQEEWPFHSFLFLITGPILLYFATQTLLSRQNSDDMAFTSSHYRAVSRRFFLILAALMVWAITLEFALGDGTLNSAFADLSALILFVALATVDSERLHAGLTVVAWFLILALVMLTGFQIID